jgi:hypothetical protein
VSTVRKKELKVKKKNDACTHTLQKLLINSEAFGSEAVKNLLIEYNSQGTVKKRITGKMSPSPDLSSLTTSDPFSCNYPVRLRWSLQRIIVVL